MSGNPEIGKSVRLGEVETNYHDLGSGPSLLMLHGSGPGVSAWANWRLPLQSLAKGFRCLALDFAGFGYSRVPLAYEFSRKSWLEQIVMFLDAMGIGKAHVIGNSFGGSMALALATHCPERVDR